MSLNDSIIAGTLNPDGTLQLDQRPTLAPGRVLVTVQPLSKPAAAVRGIVEVMDEIRASQRARGHHGRSLEEMRAEERLSQEEDTEYDRRCESLWAGPLTSPPESD